MCLKWWFEECPTRVHKECMSASFDSLWADAAAYTRRVRRVRAASGRTLRAHTTFALSYDLREFEILNAKERFKNRQVYSIGIVIN